jgi:hypothetical protein
VKYQAPKKRGRPVTKIGSTPKNFKFTDAMLADLAAIRKAKKDLTETDIIAMSLSWCRRSL